ncbi:hypothetical protein CAT7_11015 [Carnobacterium sp. AT7]|nr:hypothetical protein CAT7_11015 [Carnobacterium sp. AT7]
MGTRRAWYLYFAKKKIEGRKYRLFSAAFIPEEGVILVGTRTGKEISSFKQSLLLEA